MEASVDVASAHRHALLIGKFYPPHRGHHWLIREAAQRAERVTVVVLAAASDSISLGERISWLRDEHAADRAVSIAGVRCDAPVDITDEQVWAAQVAAMAAGARQATDEPVDVVVTSEAYGAELASRLGAAHLVIARTADGLSASRVRHDPAGHWDDLAPSVRAGLAMRVVVVGADTTDTTTLCRDLAAHYARRGGVWRRTKVVETPRSGTAGGTAEVARREDDLARAGSPLLICDSDEFAISVGTQGSARARPGESPKPEQVRSSSAPARRDVYLLGHDANESLRMQDALTAAGHSWVLLSGTPAQRLRLAVRTVDSLLSRRLAFSAPKTGPGFEPTPIAP